MSVEAITRYEGVLYLDRGDQMRGGSKGPRLLLRGVPRKRVDDRGVLAVDYANRMRLGVE